MVFPLISPFMTGLGTLLGQLAVDPRVSFIAELCDLKEVPVPKLLDVCQAPDSSL